MYSIFRYETNRFWARSELDESQPDKVSMTLFLYLYMSVVKKLVLRKL